MTNATATATKGVKARSYRRSSPPASNTGTYPLRAVIYLRVSTMGQVTTNRDSEGFSIPAQREACVRKIEDLGASFVGEYIDAGESARSADRPQLQALLERLRTERDIDLVIVHKIDRLARNRADDVEINLAITKAGARLVSVTESIDDTPSGILVHGIMSTIAEFYSRNLATEIVKGMEQKVKKGGFPTRAPLGYLNVQEFFQGSTKAVRTIKIDPDRAPLISWAFEAYASGNYTLHQLAEALAEKGLTTRPTGSKAASHLHKQHLQKILRNRTYVGLVEWNGEVYPGRHEPIVTIETFAEVQAILESRAHSREKPSLHTHYLRGSLFCKRCGSSMGFVRARGNGGVYEYFFCWSRFKKTGCDLPYIPAEIIEEQAADSYEPVQLSGQTLLKFREKIFNLMKAHLDGAEKAADKARHRIVKLEAERRTLLQAHLAGAVPVDLLREEQNRITEDLARAGAELANTEIDWVTVRTRVNAAVSLVSQLHDLYLDSEPNVRQRINQAVWAGFDVDNDGIVGSRFTDPMAAMMADDLARALKRRKTGAESADLEHLEDVRGSRLTALVDLTRLELATPALRTRCSSN